MHVAQHFCLTCLLPDEVIVHCPQVVGLHFDGHLVVLSPVCQNTINIHRHKTDNIEHIKNIYVKTQALATFALTMSSREAFISSVSLWMSDLSFSTLGNILHEKITVLLKLI